MIVTEFISTDKVIYTFKILLEPAGKQFRFHVANVYNVRQYIYLNVTEQEFGWISQSFSEEGSIENKKKFLVIDTDSQNENNTIT